MNIFVTSKCPIESAKFLDNKRVIKMILESAQLMSTVMDLNGLWQHGMYRPTHVHHPCTKWAAASWSNYWWLHRHFVGLLREYTRRYGKVHASSRLHDILMPPIGVIIDSPTSFVNCSRNKSLGIDYTDVQDTFTAYQLYLNDRWDNDKREPSWEVRA